MIKVSLRRNSVFLSLLVLFSIVRASEKKILFITNQVDQRYAYVSDEIKLLGKRLDFSAQDTPGRVALSSIINDSNEYVALELLMCAVHELRSSNYVNSDERDYLDAYYKKLIELDEHIVFDEESVRARCKTFNQLCVRGNARIGGNLIVCGTICPDPRTGQAAAGDPGATGATGSTGVTGFTGPQGAVGALGAAGQTGNTGVTGFTGFTGPIGTQGAAGAQGETGNTGSTGLTGFTGLTGNVGPAGISANASLYASYYFTGATSVTGGAATDAVGAASVPFTTQGPVNGFNLIGGTDIQVTTTGIYELTFQVLTFQEANLFAVTVNGVIVTRYTSGQKTSSPYGLGRILVNANAGDIINIKNIGVALSPSVVVSVPLSYGSGDRATASVMIRQIF